MVNGTILKVDVYQFLCHRGRGRGGGGEGGGRERGGGVEGKHSIKECLV